VAPYVQPQPGLVKGLQAIAEELFARTNPFRVTIRVQATNDHDLPVLAEVVAPGALSLTGGMSGGPDGQLYKAYDIHQGVTVVQLRTTREMIVQNDTSIDPPTIFPDSVTYGNMRAQILTALDHDGAFVGIISVHQDQPRQWSDADLRAADEATVATQQQIDQALWFDL
jgi:GAF domain-containing protein